MYFSFTSYLLGGAGALLVGLSKTGVPGVSLLAVLLMSEAFVGNEKASVAAILPLLLLGDCFSVAYYHQHADWGRLWRLFPYVAVGMVVGVFVLQRADNHQFKIVLGSLVLGLLVLETLRKRLDLDHLPHQWWFSALIGGLAGFGTMVGNAAGPIMAIYLIGRGMAKQPFMGTCAWFFLIVNFSKAPIFLSMNAWGGNEFYTAASLKFDLVVIPMVVVGAMVGRRVLQVIPQRIFDPIMLGLAGLAALRMLFG